jgi:hypothetical protein
MKLVRVVSPFFVAGLETDGFVRRAAPIISYMVGWSDDRVRKYIANRGWKASLVENPNDRKETPDP